MGSKKKYQDFNDEVEEEEEEEVGFQWDDRNSAVDSDQALDSDDEVLPIGVADDDEDLPDDRAWGRKKKDYYATDYVDGDYATSSHKDIAQAELEEQEARKIQRRLAEQLDDADFDLGLPSAPAETDDDADNVQMVKKDLSQMNNREKRALFHKENPEFQPLVTDVVDRLTEMKDILMPFIDLVKRQKVADCPGINFIKAKYDITLNYCVNISFYLMLKAKKISTLAHPIMKRLTQYRQLLNQLEEKQGGLLEEASKILAADEAALPLYNILDWTQSKSTNAKKTNFIENENGDKKTMETSDIDDEELRDGSLADEDNEALNDTENLEQNPVTMPEGEKRAITYQIAKNRGLTPYRKKELRNPRVKHRNKYRKAKIRRKGAVREVRTETKRYSGEISGIKASVKKSIKLK